MVSRAVAALDVWFVLVAREGFVPFLGRDAGHEKLSILVRKMRRSVGSFAGECGILR